VTEYAFRDTELAGRRLRLLAEVFEAPSSHFLSQVRPDRCQLAVDVGCGPGRSTQLLAEQARARRTVGLDQSDAYVDLARANTVADGISFHPHDLLGSAVSPVSAADLVWARLLLAHLPDVPIALARLARLAGAGGVVAVEEVESIQSRDEAFRRYLDVVDGVVASKGATMLAGPLVATSPDPDGAKRIHDTVVEHHVPASAAAAMFRLNLTVWRDDPAVSHLAGDGTLDSIDEDLQQRLDTTAPVTWCIRQTAWTIEGPSA
jgi:trans-aconitate 2-methyltransferase